jgi:F-box-like
MFSCDLHQFPFSSPINNLPIELLSYIFSLSSHPEEKEEEHRPPEEKEEDRPPTITTESVQVPLILSNVSRLWRQVALGTPQLWSSLCITVELVEIHERDSETETSSRLKTSLITYLSLSQKYPLDILIDARDENFNFDPEPECVIKLLSRS